MESILERLESIPELDVEKSIVTPGSEQIIKKFDISSVKKILFIIPPTFDFGDFVASSPANVATIAAYLKKSGYEVKVIDAGVHKISFESIVKLTREYGPDVVAIGCNFSTLHNPSRMVASMIKKELPGIDGAKLKADVTTNVEAFTAEIEADRAEGSAFGITGTPGFITGKVMIPGAVGIAEFKAAIDPQL